MGTITALKSIQLAAFAWMAGGLNFKESQRVRLSTRKLLRPIRGKPYAHNGIHQSSRVLAAAAVLVGVLATFCAGAQSCGIVQWGAGNGFPLGPYSSPGAACAIKNGTSVRADGFGPDAIATFGNGTVDEDAWQGTPTDGYPGSQAPCNYTETITGCPTGCNIVWQDIGDLPVVFAIPPPASCPEASRAKMTLLSLPVLVLESEVIVYGQVVPTLTTASSKSTVSFQAESVLKGNSIVAHGLILLCNSHDNSEWPDLNTLAGRVVIFVSRKGECFDLSQRHRSIVQTKAGRASTNAIKDQPGDQTVTSFLRKIRTVVAKQTQSVH